MITLRPAAERGHFDFGWLRTWHSFSFGEYHDEGWMGFRALRVINEDFIAPGRGFGQHGHRDMEIVTVPLTGGVAHKDSTGGAGVIRPGEVQRMSAGTGILHSEHNASQSEETHLLQIWLLPTERGIEPGASVAHELADGRHAWVQVARGALTLEAAAGDDRGTDRAALTAGDGAAISSAHRLQLTAGPAGAELLLFDLA